MIHIISSEYVYSIIIKTDCLKNCQRTLLALTKKYLQETIETNILSFTQHSHN